MLSELYSSIQIISLIFLYLTDYNAFSDQFLTDLFQERVGLEPREQVWEEAPNFFVNCADQADLVERSMTHRAMSVVSEYL